MKRLTGFAVITDSIGKRITYTYSKINESTGTIDSSNNKESFVVLENEELELIAKLEEKIGLRLI